MSGHGEHGGAAAVISARPAPDPDALTAGAALSRWRLPPAGWGVAASALLAVGYVAVVSLASGSWEHMVAQAGQDWPYLVLIVAGFGVQVALFSALRRARRSHGLAASSAAGGTASVVGMVACCAHHLADLLPFLAATGAAAFLTSYRVGFMAAGIAVTFAGIALAGWRLHRIHQHHRTRREDVCDVDHSPSPSPSR